MTQFLSLNSDDATNTKTLLYESIPLTGTVISGTYSEKPQPRLVTAPSKPRLRTIPSSCSEHVVGGARTRVGVFVEHVLEVFSSTCWRSSNTCWEVFQTRVGGAPTRVGVPQTRVLQLPTRVRAPPTRVGAPPTSV